MATTNSATQVSFFKKKPLFFGFFDRREVVKENSLVNAGVHSQYKAEDGRIHESERDVAKHWIDGDAMLAIYGIENQTSVDRLMPFRVIGYDGASYKSQLISDNKKIVPVITIVLYFGKEKQIRRYSY
ncbi:MAG: Rpn family recombination-promoting nuclease/putative transposase [Lachnospiraceae bacterium]|nr:Rpn family recombination-promoting nuclease/putative transposase [Lachnospiraceae bacterium]